MTGGLGSPSSYSLPGLQTSTTQVTSQMVTWRKEDVGGMNTWVWQETCPRSAVATLALLLSSKSPC